MSRAIYQTVKLEELRRHYSDLLVFFGLCNQPDSPVLANFTIGVEEYDVFSTRFPYQLVVCLCEPEIFTIVGVLKVLVVFGVFSETLNKSRSILIAVIMYGQDTCFWSLDNLSPS